MINNKDLFQVLNSWNFWNKKINLGVKRPFYVEQLSKVINRKEILIIKGIRRCGKSTIMKQLIQKLIDDAIPKKRILYINLEDVAFREFRTPELLEQIYKVFREYSNTDKKVYVFLDEIQEIKEWERWIRTYYDREESVKFIISGSNASLLSKELSTLLTGRQLSYFIKPLSYTEFLEFKPKGSQEEYLKFGGFPAVVLLDSEIEKRQLLLEYFQDILSKDVIDKQNIKDGETVKTIAKIIIENSGGKVNFSKLEKHLGYDRKKIQKYVNYMIEAYLITKVPFFSYSITKRHSILTLPKYYVTDTGFMTVVSFNFTKDLGKKFETAVLAHIFDENKNISYWDKKGEIDFLYNNKAINVTYTDEIPEREFVAFNQFKKYDKYLITKSTLDKKKGIILCNLIDFNLNHSN